MEKVISENNWVRGSCIGRGAYGTVYLGIDVSSGAVFAVKSVDLASSSGGGSPAAEAALEDEIRILKSLSSPFIVKYLGDDTSSFRRNLHMEYMPAGTAADVAAAAKSTTGFLDEAAVASYTWCLVSALGYLHSRGIVHCDVKGKNVLLGHSPGSAKLADFGSAVEISSPTAAAAAISIRGSPLWMAPEVIRGERQGTESDVWSLGCTVIEMVTGKPAWGDGGAHSVCRIGYSDELPRFPAELSRLGHDFLDKCLRRDYTERWSCDQLLHHPFVTVNTQKYSIDYSSPRCVLEDWFGSDFQDEEEEEEEEEVQNLGASERLRELVSDSGANWEYSDGWITVRCQSEDGEGTFSEYSAPIRRTNSNSSFVLLFEEQIYSHPNDVVLAHQCYEPQCFNCDRKVVSVALPSPQIKRIYKCSNFIFLCDLYTCPCFISSIFSQFGLVGKNMTFTGIKKIQTKRRRVV
ncbi:PREDICTED: mitogen-activated protein kinase kinase kinase 3 [Erythranthe guttata]|uniref:mitogen-activated protein kinase kinase kinase 3 n=1 Tax=Erythranthe guttata TaxID=4155 RepID=UPI00064D9EBA|nr:PREDICTED: mitogen-activated protein kinase kinase kinase 3 [Erythranthe guttata]|eukprot:XP_012835258.1 PREDICTED: mitogen-activated protein kinase kinase kinase 3 [Erythranthe guttata]